MPLPLAPAESSATQIEPVPLREAYRVCEETVRAHYENFPVASRFLSAEHRITLAAIYAFARRADDIADAPAPSAERLQALDTIEGALLRALDGAPQGPILTALADSVDRHRLPAEPFLDLLQAFRQDARDTAYATWDDLLGYCRGSANTIGRLVLSVYGIDDPETIRASDDVCTALQLTNFWQDLGVDLERGRLFIPLEDLRRFGIDRGSLTRPASRSALSRLLEHECRATDDLFLRGRAIVRRVPLLLSLHLRASIGGGRAVLRAVRGLGWRVLAERPTVGAAARVGIAIRSLAGLDA